jgi:hypothetical protein
MRIGIVVALFVALVVGVQSVTGRATEPGYASAPRGVAPDEPIASEALVLRPLSGELSTGTRDTRRPAAHPRTLATYRALRAYPGAPPRIPHGLTADELLATRCGTCHARGGYSARFGAYTPVTPHAELGECLQCHATDAAIVGAALPGIAPDAVCRQCHAPGAASADGVTSDWRVESWPAPLRSMPDGTPPPIPHELLSRGNCLACHAGPAAVEELRTTHGDRPDCLSCHVALSPDESVFVRPVDAGRVGGAP